MIKLPPEIVAIIETIESAGFEAYAVGGCVRDSILGREADDWDLTTNAAQEDLVRLFPEASVINKSLGVMRVTKEGITADLAAFRIDGEYKDYRRPEKVLFTGELSEDLKRRDFTMNAIAVNPFRGEIDLYHGREDIEKRLIRGIGNPERRFEEDALRILRGVRFAAQLGFDVESETLMAMKRKSMLLTHISLERILEEFCKAVGSHSCSKGLKLFSEIGAWNYILGEGCYRSATSAEWQTLYLLFDEIDNTKEDLTVRLGMIYLCFEKENAKQAIQYPGYSNQIKKLLLLAAENMDELQAIGLERQSETVSDEDFGKTALKRLISRVGMKEYQYLETVSLAYCTALGQNQDGNRIRTEMLRQITEQREPIFLSDLAVSGKDLLQAGSSEGAELGILLRALLDWVHKNPQENQKSLLLKAAEKLKG